MAEHGIDKDGFMNNIQPGSNPHSLFEERKNGKWYPRAVLVDSEDIVIDKILSSDTNFDFDMIICG